jgi:diphthamide synthase (EF-2-diphthine--ammonia ligase)
MMVSLEPVLFCWSGGKDSAMALHALQQDPSVRVLALLTTVTEGYDRVSMHGVRRELLERQAESLRLPLHEVFIPPQCVNPIYEARMEEAVKTYKRQGVRRVAFGDIFLEDLRAYRERNLAKVSMQAIFPKGSTVRPCRPSLRSDRSCGWRNDSPRNPEEKRQLRCSGGIGR